MAKNKKVDVCTRCGQIISKDLTIPIKHEHLTVKGKDEGLEAYVKMIDGLTLNVYIDKKLVESDLCRKCKIEFLNFLRGRT